MRGTAGVAGLTLWALFLCVATLFISCGRRNPARPFEAAPVAIALNFAASPGIGHVDSVRVSAFDEDHERVAGPVSVGVDPERRTFRASLSVPAGTSLTVAAEATGTYTFPDESTSEHGVIYFGAEDGITVPPDKTVQVEISLSAFVPHPLGPVVENDRLLHLSWGRVAGATSYRLWQRLAEGPATLTMADSTVALCDPDGSRLRQARIRAENPFTIGAYSDSLPLAVPQCPSSAGTYFVRSADPPDSTRDVSSTQPLTITFQRSGWRSQTDGMERCLALRGGSDTRSRSRGHSAIDSRLGAH